MSDAARNRFLGSWGGATSAGAVVIILALVVFAIVPEWLTGRALAGSPLIRDLLLIVWTTVGFVALAWLVVRLQRGPRR